MSDSAHDPLRYLGGCGFLVEAECVALLEGELDGGRRRQLDEHVAGGCGPCALLVADAAELEDISRDGITEYERSRFERGRSWLDALLRREVAGADAAAPPAAGGTVAGGALDGGAGQPRPTPLAGRALRWSSAAAAVAYLGLFYAAYLALYQLPEERSRAAALEATLEAERAAARGAAIEPWLLRPSLRGDERTTVRLRRDQAVLSLGVPLGAHARESLPRGGEVRLVFAIVTGEEAIWSWQVEPEELDRYLDPDGWMPLLVPARSLESRAYELRVTRSSVTGDERLVTIPFAIHRAD